MGILNWWLGVSLEFKREIWAADVRLRIVVRRSDLKAHGVVDLKGVILDARKG